MHGALYLLALGLVVVSFQEAAANKDGLLNRPRRATTANFDDHVRRWVDKKARQVNRRVSWYDSYGKHPHLQERPQYHRYKVSARSSPMNYNLRQLSENDKPQQVYTKWFCNHQTNQPIKTTISRELQKKAVFSWRQENGLKIGVEVSMKASIPAVMDIGASFSTELDFRGSETEVKEETETFKIQYELNIEPKTAVRAVWMITEREVEIPYDLDIFIEGYTAIWFDQKTDNHWLWFYPTSHMAEGSFRGYGGGIAYQTSGYFKGVRGVDSVVEATEFPLTPSMEGQCGGSGMANYYEGATPTKVTRVRMPLPSGEKHGEE